MELTVNKTKLILCEESLCIAVEKDGESWTWAKDYEPRLLCKEGEIRFQDARTITHTILENGVGKGIHSHYEGFLINGVTTPYEFDTFVWSEGSTDDVFFEWLPINEQGLTVNRVLWPGHMEFDEKRRDWYTLINEQQGIMIPNDWEVELGPIAFDGFFGTAGGYMPWFGQVRGKAGYIAICVTPWNAGYQAVHPAGGPYTHVGCRFEPSLGKMEYKRIARYTFLNNCDYNVLCKVYRNYAAGLGRLRTLAQKAAKTPSVDRLIGCSFIHQGIKTMVQPESEFYDPKAPEKNNHLTAFKEREKEMERIHEMGMEKVYLHLDGWAQPGYDNSHPDYLPACKEAGGWEDLKSLADHMHRWGYLFGLHDQYRDFYLAAPSFDENYACRLTDGTIPTHRRWAGGPQSYLCATQATYYVRRNFSEILSHEIHLDCAYLDVFTCNEGDECSNPMHRMTRRECYEYRNQCFEYLLSEGILPSSEEVSDWCIESLVFCHYAPYSFMMEKPGAPKQGIFVPLYNLVYHDCIIQPWMMDKVSDTEDYMLYALLNGGAPYLIRDGAYPNTDGSFDSGTEKKLEEAMERCRVAAGLHERVAKCEMVSHEMVNGDIEIQRTTFSDGTTVMVNLREQTYEIKPGRDCQNSGEKLQ